MSRDEDWWNERSIPEPNSGCYIWLGAVSVSSHYGNLKADGKYTSAHRQRYIDAHGPLPSRQCQVRHKCGNRLCVRLDHLASGTQHDNEADKKRHGTARYYGQWAKRVGRRWVAQER